MGSKINLSPPVASAAVHSKAVVRLLFIHCLLLPHCLFACLLLFFSFFFFFFLGGGGVWGVGLSVRYLYFVSFLVLQSSRWGRELIVLLLLCSECHVDVIVL